MRGQCRKLMYVMHMCTYINVSAHEHNSLKGVGLVHYNSKALSVL